MSEEARKLVDDFDDAVVRCAETTPEDRREFKDAHAKWSAAQHALLAYIERIERERDAQSVFEASYRKRLVVLDKRIAELTRERDEARTILAHTDIGSLPDDWTLKQVAEARIDDLMKLRDQVRDTCARAEKAEAENARLRQISTQRGAKMQLLREYFTPTEWHNFVGIRPEAAAWFDSDGVPIDAARKL